MGLRIKSLAMIAAMLGAAGAAVTLLGGNSAVAPGHRPGHINCPPGSHVTPSNLTYGKEFEMARAKTMDARRMTEGHPAQLP